MTPVILDPRRDSMDGRFAVRVLCDLDGTELDYVGWYDALDEALDEARATLTSEMYVEQVLDCVTLVW